MAISVYGGKNESEKNVLNNFQMSEQYWDCLGKMSEVNVGPAETLGMFLIMPCSKTAQMVLLS